MVLSSVVVWFGMLVRCRVVFFGMWFDLSMFFFFQDLIDHMLVVDANRRYSAEQVLSHPWIKVRMAN